MHNKWVWIILKHPHRHQPQPTPSIEKLSFTEPGPWCQKGWGVLAKATWPVPSFCWDRTTQKGAHSFGILQRLLRKLLKTENLKLSCNDWEKRGEARAAAPAAPALRKASLLGTTPTSPRRRQEEGHELKWASLERGPWPWVLEWHPQPQTPRKRWANKQLSLSPRLLKWLVDPRTHIVCVCVCERERERERGEALLWGTWGKGESSVGEGSSFLYWIPMTCMLEWLWSD